MKRPKLMTVLNIRHIRDGVCIWQEQNISNTWHNEGQEFILNLAFNTDFGGTVPPAYYLGLDNRETLAVTDTMASLDGEPTSNGYARQAFSSSAGFVISTEGGVVIATSGIATFVATSGQWGPVRNTFLTNRADNDGYLIASAALSSQRTVVGGDSIPARINLSLGGC